MAVQPDLNWRPVLKSRLMVAAGVLVLWVVAIEVRLIVLQVMQHDQLVARAERQQMSTLAAPAKRGEIFDRNGRVLAYSVDADTIYAVPTDITDSTATAAALCGALNDCTKKMRDELRDRLAQDRAFVYVRRRSTPTQAKRVAHVVKSCFNGRRIVVFSGGAAKGANAVYQDARDIRDGGGNGSIIGRNTFQRPRDEAVAMLDKLVRIYKGEE